MTADDASWEAAGRHGLQPLLYRHLADGCPEAVPVARLAELRECYQANRGRALLLSGELVALVALFQEHGILAIPFKGPVLGAALYGDVTLREFGDLDLFVRRRDVPLVAALLEDRGYQQLFRVSSRQEAASNSPPKAAGVTTARSRSIRATTARSGTRPSTTRPRARRRAPEGG